MLQSQPKSHVKCARMVVANAAMAGIIVAVVAIATTGVVKTWVNNRLTISVVNARNATTATNAMSKKHLVRSRPLQMASVRNAVRVASARSVSVRNMKLSRTS